jgi:hypothetical protein
MGPAGSMIEVVGGYHFIFDTLVVVLEAMFCVITFKDEQVFYLELIIFVPTNSETILFSGSSASFLDF